MAPSLPPERGAGIKRGQGWWNLVFAVIHVTPVGLCWAVGGPVTPSCLSQHLSPQGGEEQGTSTLGGTEEQGGEPPPLWVLPAWLSPQTGEQCPQTVPTQVPTQGGACWPPHRDTMSVPWAPRGHKDVPPLDASQALASNTHEERGRGQGCPILGEQVDVAVPWGQTGAQRVAGGCSHARRAAGWQLHPPWRMLGRGRVNCPTKSLQEVLS